MLKAHADIIWAVTGAFMFLPTLAKAIYLPPPAWGVDEKSIQAMGLYFEANIVPLISLQLVSLLGCGTLLSLFLNPSRPTVGDAIGSALRMLPTLFFISLIERLLISLCFGPLILVARILSDGFLTYFLAAASFAAAIFFAIVIFARTFIADSSAMADEIRNPITSITTSFRLTRGVFWQMFGLIVILAVVTWI